MVWAYVNEHDILIQIFAAGYNMLGYYNINMLLIYYICIV